MATHFDQRGLEFCNSCTKIMYVSALKYEREYCLDYLAGYDCMHLEDLDSCKCSF